MATKQSTIEIPQTKTETVELFVLGAAPLIMNCMSEKVKQGLMAPAPPKNRADRASKLKHDPIAEYRNSMYYMPRGRETILGMPATAFKTAMITAAKDVPGSSKAQMGRLTFVESDMVGIYGKPQLLNSVTRSSDINRTPDVRTRAILPVWAACVRITFVTPILRFKDIYNLMAFAGITVGIGDWRQEKGSGNYGRWEIVNPDDPRYVAVVENGALLQQEQAIKEPAMYDKESEELMKWFFSYAEERGFNPTR